MRVLNETTRVIMFAGVKIQPGTIATVDDALAKQQMQTFTVKMWFQDGDLVIVNHEQDAKGKNKKDI